MEPLREEIIGVVVESGWSKKSIDRLDKLDSFIRETQRMSPLSAGESITTLDIHDTNPQYRPSFLVSIQRLAVDDFTFSNGVHIPKGTLIHGPAAAIEADPAIYSDPEVFKPFRFVPDASKPEQPRKEMTTIGPDFLPFGYGRNAWYALTGITPCQVHHRVISVPLTFSRGQPRPLVCPAGDQDNHSAPAPTLRL